MIVQPEATKPETLNRFKSKCLEPHNIYVTSFNQHSNQITRSNNVTDRSTSRRKVMISNSHKLADFFSASKTMQGSSTKSFSSSSSKRQMVNNPQRYPDKDNEPMMAKKKQFLRYQNHNDYLHDQTAVVKKKDIIELQLQNDKKQNKGGFLGDVKVKQINRNLGAWNEHNNNYYQIKSIKSATYINPQKNIDLSRLKNTKMPLIKPIFSKQRAGRKKNSDKLVGMQKGNDKNKNFLEYTFGLS